MKKSLIIVTALAAFVVAPASAADLAVKAYSPAPLGVATYNWTGCYLGVHAGGGVMKDTQVESNLFAGGGGIAGGQAGCNYQVNQLVLGFEGEAWWSSLRDRANYNNTDSTTSYIRNNTYSTQVKNKWDADLSIRVGYAFDRVLVYGKAGAAIGGFDYSSSSTDSITYFNSPQSNYTRLYTDRGGKNLYGMLLGVGLEWAFLDNWTTKVEANYINYVAGDLPVTNCQSGTGSQLSPNTCNSNTSTIAASKLLVKMGLNYKFGGPAVARY